MTLHKLTAGDGYTYLTRQVAAHDATQRGYEGLGDYYSARGESPGVWMGRGLPDLLDFSDRPQVSEAQMTALFGEGRHPDAAAIEARMRAEGRSVEAILAATQLGSPFRIHTEVTRFRQKVARRFDEWNATHGSRRGEPIPDEVRAQIRTEVAVEMFTGEFGRPPANPRELAGFVARHSRQATTAVAGYDLTFSPVKSVSALWAVAPADAAEAIEQAHDAAVADTLAWLEDHATYSRTGRNGVRQVDVTGLIAAAFTHRDSRAGDPDLHTHVAISNKVRTLDGRWLALDGRPLHKMAVAASERYNTRLEAHLREKLGVRFAARNPSDPSKRPVREIVGVDEKLSAAWSSRRHAIDTRRAQLAAKFQQDHGRPPTVVEALRLAQQATLETRDPKHEPRSLAEQRAAWREQAVDLLGGRHNLDAMLTLVLWPKTQQQQAAPPAADWVLRQAQRVVATVEAARATWQETHLRAEAERVCRAADIALRHIDDTVDAIVQAGLDPAVSIPLRTADAIEEPAVLRRRDGTSVYTHAGTQLYTSARILAAEQRLLEHACSRDKRAVRPETVEIALLESAANGVELNTGQAQLVRELATSGARLQLALAPAGTGKTTAMRVLTAAWVGDGGDVIGLAPSAAAAAVLHHETGVRADTLAKLNHSLDTGKLPSWVENIGPKTLVVVDEAGMAGTADLAQAVEFITARGGSVRLIGDDQQLAAVGAGGVLRDIAETTGAVTLSEVMRFHDPAEGAASLGLRAGDPAALAYYIDNDRVHLGDQTTVADTAYRAWKKDVAAGIDALMLAPTRELVAALNARARADRIDVLDGAGPEIRLGDGTFASTGDVVITRRNERQLAISATDWVKNGDRWTITAVNPDHSVDVTHCHTGRHLRLPAGYVAEHVALGYAATVHAAQGATAQRCHTVVTGQETRQLLYVAMTRGRSANHLYLAGAADGDPHSVITRDALLPPTAIDILTSILARDDTPTSARSSANQLSNPASVLASAADKYADALTEAARETLGGQRMNTLAAAAEQRLPGLTTRPAWETLQSHLALLELSGADPVAALDHAINERELDSAADPAAVLDWRLDPTGRHSASPGPLRWLPAVPQSLLDNPRWGDYLTARANQVRDLADQVAASTREWTPSSAPSWARPLLDADRTLVADLTVWRAATAVPEHDTVPTGPRRVRAAEIRAQQGLNARVRAHLGYRDSEAQHWAPLARAIDARLLADPFWPQLAARLSVASRAGIDIGAAAIDEAAARPLPDEYPAAALWWRLSRRLAPAALTADHTGPATPLRPPWTADVPETLGEPLAKRVIADPAWPALVAAVSAAAHRGWLPREVLATAHDLMLTGQGDTPLRGDELATALTWRVEMLAAATTPGADNATADDLPEPPDDDDLASDDPELEVSEADRRWLAEQTRPEQPIAGPAQDAAPSWFLQPPPARREPPATPAISVERIAAVNELAQSYFAAHYPGSWAARLLIERLGTDVASDPRYTPGYAPAGWTSLVNHLRSHGVSEEEMLAAGLASHTRGGRVIDRFRDRLMMPIRDERHILGFIGRRHPDHQNAGPKYLNAPQTSLYEKGKQLFGLVEAAAELDEGATPVLVEGFVDAIAVTVATEGKAVGVAALGTAFTDSHADQLRPYIGPGTPGIIVATDADPAGLKAATRAYWHLAARGDNPRYLHLPPGFDPAELLQTGGPAVLRQMLDAATPLVRHIIDTRIGVYADRLHTVEGQVGAARAAAQAVGALPPDQWAEHIAYIDAQLDLTPGAVHLHVLGAGHEWGDDPLGMAQRRAAEPAPIHLPFADPDSAQPRSEHVGPALAPWEVLAARVDPRVVDDPHWPTLAAGLETAAAAGYDIRAHLAELAESGCPLPARHPARALHYRLIARTPAAAIPATGTNPAARRQKEPTKSPAPTSRPQASGDANRDPRRQSGR